MQKKHYIIFICAFISLGLHLYLSSRSYSLSAGEASYSAVCHVSDTVNCDNVLNSPYSRFMNIPLSNIGFSLNLIILFLALCLILGWAENRSTTWLTLCLLVFLSAEASVIMLGISSFVLHFFCPLCIALYVLSFICFACIITSLKDIFVRANLKKIYHFIFPKLLISGILISWLLHVMFLNTYDIKSIQKTVKLNTQDWISAPLKNNKIKPLLIIGPSAQKAVVTLTEFADFLCGHCRESYLYLKAFKITNPQIRVEYFSFPLDQCKTTRATCALTRATYCAEKQNQGWNIHNLIFKNQNKFKNAKSDKHTLKKLQNLSAALNLNWDVLNKCTQSAATVTMLNDQIKAGKQMEIKGTPSLFINQKSIPNSYIIQTIKAIIKHLN